MKMEVVTRGIPIFMVDFFYRPGMKFINSSVVSTCFDYLSLVDIDLWDLVSQVVQYI